VTDGEQRRRHYIWGLLAGLSGIDTDRLGTKLAPGGRYAPETRVARIVSEVTRPAPVLLEAVRFARVEGIIPAPEPSHALRAVAEEVERAREEGVERTILFNLCGHGNFDMAAYDSYLSGEMVDFELPQSELDLAAAELEGLPALPQ
jgi:tryptophan synthase beta subunit